MWSTVNILLSADTDHTPVLDFLRIHPIRYTGELPSGFAGLGAYTPVDQRHNILSPAQGSQQVFFLF